MLFARFRSPERGIYALAFSPSQPILTGSGPNQSLFHWTIDECAAVELIEKAVGDPLTEAERTLSHPWSQAPLVEPTTGRFHQESTSSQFLAFRAY